MLSTKNDNLYIRFVWNSRLWWTFPSCVCEVQCGCVWVLKAGSFCMASSLHINWYSTFYPAQEKPLSAVRLKKLKIDYTFRFTFLVGADCLLAHSNLNLRASTHFPIAIFISSVKDFQSENTSSNHALETKCWNVRKDREGFDGLTFWPVFHVSFFMSPSSPNHTSKKLFLVKIEE